MTSARASGLPFSATLWNLTPGNHLGRCFNDGKTSTVTKMLDVGWQTNQERLEDKPRYPPFATSAKMALIPSGILINGCSKSLGVIPYVIDKIASTAALETEEKGVVKT